MGDVPGTESIPASPAPSTHSSKRRPSATRRNNHSYSSNNSNTNNNSNKPRPPAGSFYRRDSSHSSASGSIGQLSPDDNDPSGLNTTSTRTGRVAAGQGATSKQSKSSNASSGKGKATSQSGGTSAKTSPQSPQSGRFLSRFVSTFRPQLPDSRPVMPRRSLSSPNTLRRTISADPTLETDPDPSLAPPLTDFFPTSTQPRFERRANSATSTTSPKMSAASSPIPAYSNKSVSSSSPNSANVRGQEVNPMSDLEPLAYDETVQTPTLSNFSSVAMAKRGSGMSQRTLQRGSATNQGRGASPSPALASPLGYRRNYDKEKNLEHEETSSSSASGVIPPEQSFEILSALTSSALLLFTHLGPAHLFNPPLPIASSTSSSSPEHAPFSPSKPQNNSIASDRASITSSTSSSSYPTPLLSHQGPSYSHERTAASTISVPVVSAAATWRLLRGLEWLSKLGKETKGSALKEENEDTEEEPLLDFPSVLQGVADMLSADAATKGVELVIGQVGRNASPSPVSTPMPLNGDHNTQEGPVKHEPSISSTSASTQESSRDDTETRELIVRADERAWSILLFYVIHHIISACPAGSTLEVRFQAVLLPNPVSSKLEESGSGSGSGSGSQKTILATRNTLQKWWNVILEIVLTNEIFAPTALGQSKRRSGVYENHTPLFSSSSARRMLSHFETTVEEQTPPQTGSRMWKLSSVLPGARPIITPEDPSALLGRRRASLESAGQEPTLDDFRRFIDVSLKGLAVALHSGERSTFAKHLIVYLASWGMDVSHVPLEGGHRSDNASHNPSDWIWNTAKRDPVSRFDSGFGSSPPPESSEPVNSPLKSHGQDPVSPPGSFGGSEESMLNLIIIDDDVPTLRRILQSFRAMPLHYAPTLMNKRPQLASRRTRSSPHVRQLSQVPQALPANSTIIHFTSITQYKAIKEAVRDALSNERFHIIPDVLVIPKPAGPRRILTSLWTALKKPSSDPSLQPIATSPTSPGGQYWTPKLSPAISTHQQDFDSAVTEALNNRSENPMSEKSKPSTPPATYFPPGATPGIPPSPLGKISDEQASYFSDVADNMDGTTPSEGMVIQSPDGRSAIFFQPQTRGVRATSAAERDKPLRDVRDESHSTTTGASSPPARGNVNAPRDFGLGQPRRVSAGSNSNDLDSPPLPIGTPALALESFISQAASVRAQSEDHTSPIEEHREVPLSRTHSTSSNHRSASIRSIAGSHSPRGTTEIPPVASISRKASGTSPPTSPIVNAILPTLGSPRRPKETSAPSSGYFKKDRPAIDTQPRKRRSTKTKPLATVPPINVLIVEDNPINQTILSMFMKKKGIKYAVAKDGEEAVQKWKAGNFHLVLMDIQLPVKDGIEATREIREMERADNIGTFITTPTSDLNSPTSSHSNIAASFGFGSSPSASHSKDSPISPLLSMPVIIVALTASSLQIDRVTALAAGCNDFLTKPVSLPWLQQKLLEWGSMAYLSGFSQRETPNRTIASVKSHDLGPTFATGMNRSKADFVSSHLHIDPHPKGQPQQQQQSSAKASPEEKPLTKSSPPPTTSMSGAPTPLGPQLNIINPTPGQTPQAFKVPIVSEAIQETRVGSHDADPNYIADQHDLSALDDKLRDVQAHDQEAAKIPDRPGPTPLTRKAPTGEEPPLADIVAEGARLAEAGRSRSGSLVVNSFSQVMHSSGKHS